MRPAHYTTTSYLVQRRHAARCTAGLVVFGVLFSGGLWGPSGVALGQAPEAAKASSEEGIPVTDPLVKAKCGGTCHASDERGNLLRISWARTTPEGWQDVLKRMILADGLMVTPAEARTIVKYLSSANGLAPEEARPVMYDVERRIRDEVDIPTENLRTACAKCHGFARAMSWRRSAEDWKALVDSHATRYKIPTNDEAVAFLAKSAPLHSPEWVSWSASAATHTSKLAGRWFVTASMPGRGKYYGEMDMAATGGSDDEFNTTVKLKSVRDGSTIVRSGRSAVYGGYAWRGRSKGSAPGSAPDDPGNDAREVMWISADQSIGEGRWFWGQYQEFGFDVKLQRASTMPTLLGVDRPSLKIASQGTSVHLIGDNLPAQLTAADVSFGPGVTVRRVISSTASESVVEVDVSANAATGKRDVAVRGAVAPGAMAIYDRVDYVKVTPESSLAAFGDREHMRGYQQFEAIGYQRGADGKRHTADDVELGPVNVEWSMEIFYAPEGSATDNVGKVSSTGFFTPAPESPKNNFDIWIIATAAGEKDADGTPLVGKAYLVLTVPAYTFNGRRYVRDLDRWVDDGPARGAQ